MPRLPDVPGVLRIRLIGLINSSPWNVVHYAKYAGPLPTSAELQAVGTGVGTSWLNSVGVMCHATVTVAQVEVTDLSSADANVGVANVSHQGGRAGTGNPNNVACVASYKINVRYRGGHPRSYWPMGVSSDITQGRLWTSTFLPLAQNAASSYVGNVNNIVLGSGSLTFCAVSFYQGKDPATGKPIVREDPLPFTVQSVTVHQRVDSMRTRLGREIA